MKYLHSARQSFEFLASGRVIYGAKGNPNFPVKLSNEIYNRCLKYLKEKNNITVYDPCCGGGYLLTTMSLLNYRSIDKIYGTDISLDALSIAKKNFSLLSRKGIAQREKEIQMLYDKYLKESHLAALSSVEKFYKIVKGKENPISSIVFQRDILNKNQNDKLKLRANLVITDVPYGRLVNWSEQKGIDLLLDNISSQLDNDSVVAIIRDKKQKRTNSNYHRLEKFQVGKRVIEMLKLN